jgi:glycosyltransferase involved in cell wall biosynthesis
MLLSICLITYNHEKYIREAIEGILIQKTNFDFELVIGEDSSSDNTRDICVEYAEKYPHLIKLLPKTKNLGMMPNFVRTYNACIGEFIALIEGDDYWTDPEKLQKQVDYLIQNPGCSICAHDVNIVYENVPEIYPFQKIWNNEFFYFEDVLDFHFISTLSILFRRKYLNNLPDWFNNLIVGDIPIVLILSSKGYGKYFLNKMGVKRKNENGITFDPERRKLELEPLFYKIYKDVFNYLNHDKKKLFELKFAGYERAFALKALENKDYLRLIYFSLRAFWYDPKWIFYKIAKLN